MVQISGLVLRATGKNTCTYYCRVAVPKADRERVGRREIWHSLRTRDKQEAIAALPTAMASVESKLTTNLSSGPGAISVQSRPAALECRADDVARLAIKLGEARYRTVLEQDMLVRVTLCMQARNDVAAFWAGKLVPLPQTPFMSRILEASDFQLRDALSYYWWHHLGERITTLKICLSAGDFAEAEAPLEALLAPHGDLALDRMS